MDFLDNTNHNKNIFNTNHLFHAYDEINYNKNKNLINNVIHQNEHNHDDQQNDNNDNKEHNQHIGDNTHHNDTHNHTHNDTHNHTHNDTHNHTHSDNYIDIHIDNHIDNHNDNDIKNCYSFHHIKNSSGFFDDSISATYIIHLENNGHIDNIYKQLSYYHPTTDVFILYNKVYKKCKKPDYINYPSLDLVDAYLQVFKHSQDNGYHNILILEDDFSFDQKIKNKNIINDINSFIKEKTFNNNDNRFVYMLGTLPWWRIPISTTHSRVLLSTGSHSCIYSKSYVNDVLKKLDNNPNLNKDQIKDWDFYLNFNNFTWNRYMYNKPLCYQLFPENENSKLWADSVINDTNTFLKIFILFFRSIMIFIFNALNLDKQYNPGYIFFYIFSIVIGTATILAILFFIGVLFLSIFYFSLGKRFDFKTWFNDARNGNFSQSGGSYSSPSNDLLNDVNGFFKMIVSKLS